ncbi:MAG: hypothetical protein ACP5F6_02660 [Microbacter sp.]
MKKVVLSFMLLMMVNLLSAQTTGTPTDAFKPSGKPIVTIFTDFTSTTSNGKTNNAFELSRAYFGYGYHFSRNFYGKIVLDVANAPAVTTSSFTALLKNAFLEYANPMVSVDFGMICTSQFSLQEAVWGKRFLAKTLQDQYGFSSSADLGADVTFKLAPQVSFDVQWLNGEGYQKIQSDSTLKVAAGVTVKPIKNLVARVYVDYMKKNVAQKSFNAFLAYTGERITLGAEYDMQVGNKMIQDHNFSGISLYGTYNLENYMAIFVRFDDLTSKKIGSSTSGWNSCDGQTYMAGLVFSPVKGVQISPNCRYWHPSSDLNHGSTVFALNLGLNL